MVEARRHRKVFGGGMRQVGIIAAGALYALQHHRERLVDDHRNAQIVAEGVRAADGLTLEPSEIDSNMIIFRVDPALGTAPEVVAALQEKGVLVLAIGPDKVRAVTHLDVDEAGVRRGAEAIGEAAAELAAGKRPPAHDIAAY